MALPESLQSLPAGQQKLPREVMEAHQRERVLRAAVEVFAKRGYPATRIDHIVDASQMGMSSFYSLFDGKEDVFLRAFDQLTAAARERLIAAMPPCAAPWPERLAATLRGLLAEIEADPLAARLVFVEARTAGEAALARYEAGLEAAAEWLQGARRASPYAAELPRSLEFATVGGLVWFLQQRIVQGEASRASEFLPQALEIVVEPYFGAAASAELLDVD